MADQNTIEIQLNANLQHINAALDARDARRFKLLAKRRAALWRQLAATIPSKVVV